MSDVTRLLDAAAAGDRQAAADLLPLVYDELRKLAAAWMSHAQPPTPTGPTPRSGSTVASPANSPQRADFFISAEAHCRRISQCLADGCFSLFGRSARYY